MHRAVHKLFEARLGKDLFEFDSNTKQTELEPQFWARLINKPNLNLTVFDLIKLANLVYR